MEVMGNVTYQPGIIGCLIITGSCRLICINLHLFFKYIGCTWTIPISPNMLIQIDNSTMIAYMNVHFIAIHSIYPPVLVYPAVAHYLLAHHLLGLLHRQNLHHFRD